MHRAARELAHRQRALVVIGCRPLDAVAGLHQNRMILIPSEQPCAGNAGNRQNGAHAVHAGVVYSDDGTIRQVGKGTYGEDRGYGARNVETDVRSKRGTNGESRVDVRLMYLGVGNPFFGRR